MATDEIFSTGAVPNIGAFITACAFPPEAFVLVERFPRQVITDPAERQDLLRFARLGDSFDPGTSISGRVFDQHFELRWEQEPQGTRVVYVGQARELPELPSGKPLDEWLPGIQTCERSYYLFGEYLDKNRLKQMGLPEERDYYAEVRIPRLLHYPLRARRVQLAVREYVDTATGRVHLFRFLKLKAGEESA
jgi:hypothetical protein